LRENIHVVPFLRVLMSTRVIGGFYDGFGGRAGTTHRTCVASFLILRIRRWRVVRRRENAAVALYTQMPQTIVI
jgi:hypothetical protein